MDVVTNELHSKAKAYIFDYGRSSCYHYFHCDPVRDLNYFGEASQIVRFSFALLASLQLD